ncbi:hypothetical protein NC99_32470 [Sunxiuqinia dokdonensis]|uniref:Uncharacterized protein n=1 Tax=Sunxiuqinia dokdonensis TaxID=1409788 RepID=A0A0L8V687_9BACT|nr:hypothetical protein NC99_32470 [Sunxiuqinia dokdonensis]
MLMNEDEVACLLTTDWLEQLSFFKSTFKKLLNQFFQL